MLAPFNSYFFFIDLDPYNVAWSHPCIYVFINNENGEIYEYYKTSPPQHMNLVLPVFITDFIPKKTDFIDSLEMYTNHPGIKQKSATVNNDNFALLICGGYDKNQNYIGFWNSVKLVYDKLVNDLDYSSDNIIVCMSDGTNPVDDRKYCYSSLNNSCTSYRYDNSPTIGKVSNTKGATKSEIEYAFIDLSNKITNNHNANLFIYVSDHGDIDPSIGDVYINLWNQEKLYPDEFRTFLETYINQYVHKYVLLDFCHSGGFTNTFNNLNSTGVLAACGRNEVTYLGIGNRNEKTMYATAWCNAVTNVGADVGNDGISMLDVFNYLNNMNYSTTGRTQNYYSYPSPFGSHLIVNSVTSESNCYNGLLDNAEQDVDCGGVCNNQCIIVVPWPETCNDGKQNQDETGVDCGGVCPPCGIGGDLNNIVTSNNCSCGGQGISQLTNGSSFPSIISGANIMYIKNFKISHGNYDFVSNSGNAINCGSNYGERFSYSIFNGGLYFEEDGFQFAPDKMYKLKFNYWRNTGTIHIKLANGLTHSLSNEDFYQHSDGSYANYSATSIENSAPTISSSYNLGFVHGTDPYVEDDEPYYYCELTLTFQPDDYYSQLWFVRESNSSYSGFNSLKLEEMCISDFVYNSISSNVYNPTRASNSIAFKDFVFQPENSVSFIAGEHIILKENTTLGPQAGGSITLSIDNSFCGPTLKKAEAIFENYLYSKHLEDKKSILITYPNPCSDILNIEYHTENEGLSQLSIWDVNGKLVLKKNITSGIHKIDVTFFEQGVFFLKILNGQEILYRKIIIN